MSDHRKWKKPPLISSPLLRYGLLLGTAVYLALAFGTMEVDWERVAEGTTRGKRFLGSFFPPTSFHGGIPSSTALWKACG